MSFDSVRYFVNRLLNVWHNIELRVIDAAIDHWRAELEACVHADGNDQCWRQTFWRHAVTKSAKTYEQEIFKCK